MLVDQYPESAPDGIGSRLDHTCGDEFIHAGGETFVDPDHELRHVHSIAQCVAQCNRHRRGGPRIGVAADTDAVIVSSSRSFL